MQQFSFVCRRFTWRVYLKDRCPLHTLQRIRPGVSIHTMKPTCSYACGPSAYLKKNCNRVRPAFESGFTGHIKERGQKVKRLKIAEIRAEIKPLIQSGLPKGRKRIKRNMFSQATHLAPLSWYAPSPRLTGELRANSAWSPELPWVRHSSCLGGNAGFSHVTLRYKR